MPDLTKLSSYRYDLPQELIAQTPTDRRDASRLLVVGRGDKTEADRHFSDIVEYLNAGDCLVINETKVIPARLMGRTASGTQAEVLLLSRLEGDVWRCMTRPGKKTRVGDVVDFGRMRGVVVGTTEDGLRDVRFEYEGVFNELLDEIGVMPLPPYIHERLEDGSRYQTVYARTEGSAAAPTAGLHFTDALLDRLKNKGVEIVEVLLHVGLGTFRPVKEEDISRHKMHSEFYSVSSETASALNRAKREGRRTVAVGTTSVRVLESASDENGLVSAGSGNTEIFIYPPYKFKATDAMITNFHLPKSTLLMLVSAFAGRENILKVYEAAVREKYRFFSFGDAMFLKK